MKHKQHYSLTVVMLSPCVYTGMDLGGLRMCFKFKELDKGAFFVGSADGELVYAEFIRPEGEENPEYTKSCVQVRRFWGV